MRNIEHCSICKKHNFTSEYRIFENATLKVYHGPFESQLLGYYYIEPKRHVENWHSLNQEEMADISLVMQRLTALLEKRFDAERVYTVCISEQVRHLHIHVIPRYKDEKIKGLDLIKQATQQHLLTTRRYSQEEYERCITYSSQFMLN